MAQIKEVKKVETKEDEAPSRNKTSCPYFDLEQSIKVAQAIYSNGGGSCTADQLAHWLDYASVRSGTYLTRVSAAKSFGLVESSGNKLSVTERAKKILTPVMPDDATNAKVDAFLSVPLFSKVFEQFRGSQLPPEIGLKNLFQETYKVLKDRSSPAVRIFLNSSEQAGMLVGESGKQRLIKPSIPGIQASSPTKSDTSDERSPDKPKGSGEGPPGGIHTAIVGVLRELPPPGSPFPAASKQRFLSALKAVLDWVYPEPEEKQ